MAETIHIPVKALDEKCISCNCLDIEKNTLYGGCDIVMTEYSCSHFHLCTFIRNRIVRNEQAAQKEKDKEE